MNTVFDSISPKKEVLTYQRKSKNLAIAIWRKRCEKFDFSEIEAKVAILRDL